MIISIQFFLFTYLLSSPKVNYEVGTSKRKKQKRNTQPKIKQDKLYRSANRENATSVIAPAIIRQEYI
jgi:hypothetical protein